MPVPISVGITTFFFDALPESAPPGEHDARPTAALVRCNSEAVPRSASQRSGRHPRRGISRRSPTSRQSSTGRSSSCATRSSHSSSSLHMEYDMADMASTRPGARQNDLRQPAGHESACVNCSGLRSCPLSFEDLSTVSAHARRPLTRAATGEYRCVVHRRRRPPAWARVTHAVTNASARGTVPGCALTSNAVCE